MSNPVDKMIEASSAADDLKEILENSETVKSISLRVIKIKELNNSIDVAKKGIKKATAELKEIINNPVLLKRILKNLETVHQLKSVDKTIDEKIADISDIITMSIVAQGKPQAAMFINNADLIKNKIKEKRGETEDETE